MQATATGAFLADRDGVNTSGSAHVPDIRVVDFQEASVLGYLAMLTSHDVQARLR
jgi:hypothetical protein